jgi:DNA invertase Pin-like site-specific DNA recombinase
MLVAMTTTQPAKTQLRAAIYTRISNDPSGQELGVTRQLDDCQALAKVLRWEIVTTYTDNDLSAFNGKTRPGFEAMLDGIKHGEFGALIVWHHDRLYRSLRDLQRLIDVARPVNMLIKTVQGGDIDLSNATGRMLATIVGSVSQAESEHKSERQKRANVQRAEAGKWATINRCFGYTTTGEPLEPEATAVRTAVADVLAGKSIRKVATEWNAKGLRTTLAGKAYTHPGGTKVTTVSGAWNSPRVRRVLMNPRYASLRVYRGKVIGKGDWKPLIDKATHDGLVAYLSDPARRTTSTFERKYIGSGIYRCGKCDGPMRAQRPKERKSYAYVCRDHAHLLRAGRQLDDYVTSIVLGRLSQPDAHLLLDDKRIDIPALQTESNGLASRLNKLADAFAEGDISDEQLRTGTAKLRTKLAEIDSQLADAARTDPVAGLIADRKRVQERWDACTPAAQGQIIDALVTVTILPIPEHLKGPRVFDPAYVRIEWKR